MGAVQKHPHLAVCGLLSSPSLVAPCLLVDMSRMSEVTASDAWRTEACQMRAHKASNVCATLDTSVKAVDPARLAKQELSNQVDSKCAPP